MGIEPSPVVRQLLEMLDGVYVDDSESLIRRVPLRRHAGDHEAFDQIHRERRAQAIGEALQARNIKSPTDEELRGLAVQSRGLAEALSLRPLPRRNTSTAPTRISLQHIRRFLEAPIQGWAQAVLGMVEARTHSPGVEDEPLHATALHNGYDSARGLC